MSRLAVSSTIYSPGPLFLSASTSRFRSILLGNRQPQLVIRLAGPTKDQKELLEWVNWFVNDLVTFAMQKVNSCNLVDNGPLLNSNVLFSHYMLIIIIIINKIINSFNMCDCMQMYKICVFRTACPKLFKKWSLYHVQSVAAHCPMCSSVAPPICDTSHSTARCWWTPCCGTALTYSQLVRSKWSLMYSLVVTNSTHFFSTYPLPYW